VIEWSILTERHFTACASLAALGVQLKHLDLFGPIRETVLIAQKTIKHAPSDKLYDAFISLLAGAGGLVEINHRLRADPALQRAFGRGAGGNQPSSQSRSSLAASVWTRGVRRAVGGARDVERLHG